MMETNLCQTLHSAPRLPSHLILMQVRGQSLMLDLKPQLCKLSVSLLLPYHTQTASGHTEIQTRSV